MKPIATREVELELAARHGIVIGMDEVGRGALAGPVVVGACAIRGDEGEPPPGLTDSKALTVKQRELMRPAAAQWAADWALGWASPAEIDQWGIVWGLRLAGMRALADLAERGTVADVVLLDGSHDWLTAPHDLFADLDDPKTPDVTVPDVVMKVKADATCAVVSAASVIAKVERDAYMAGLDDPGYGWASNKGYSSPSHLAGLRTLGACQWHRRSWQLPQTSATPSSSVY